MDITRRDVVKGLAAAGISSAILPVTADQGDMPQPSSVPTSFSSLDEIFANSIIIDDLSGFEPKSSEPDAGFGAIKESGITVVAPTLGEVVPEIAFHSTVESISKQIDQIDKYPDRMMLIRAYSDFERAKRQNKLGVLINVQNSACIERDLKNLDLFYGLGLRQIQLTFNWRNWVGDGCTERTQAGLSYYGVDMVHRMNEIGMIVDVGHTGYQSTLDAVEVSNVPIVYSHTNCKALCDHPRNKTDDQIKALAKKGGVIGLSFFNWFVSDKPRSTLSDVLDHFDHVAKLVGPDYVGIGSDFSVPGWPGKVPDAEWEEHKKLYGEREWKTLKGRFPPYIDELNNAHKYHGLAEGLRNRGWSYNDIAKALGLNFLRVYKHVMKT
jgi:membrane dipeptidase